MALKGTLKDFGIADIFQLISHQSKTGVLLLSNKGQEVRISFSNGDVVWAESSTRKKQDLLGSMLVRAEALSQDQVEEALEIQRRTLKRLGHVLLERQMLSQADLKQFTMLQTTETIYKLFNWESGTYEFETVEVTVDREAMEPLRSENVLMEGFRMMDEWPMIRKRITSFDMTFKVLKPLHPPQAAPGSADEVDSAFDDMFASAKKDKSALGNDEHLVFGLIQEGRSVQKLIDLSRLGEFETCKALSNLILEGHIRVEAGGRDKDREAPGARVGRFPIARVLVQISMYLVILGLLFVLYRALNIDMLDLLERSARQRFREPHAKEALAVLQIERLRGALEVYRMERGSYPEKLEELTSAGLVRQGELAFPWRSAYVYLRQEAGYLLLRPFE